jgi:hypothetical protein
MTDNLKTLTEHPAFKLAYAETSEAMRRVYAEEAMVRRDPVQAILLRIDAIASHRAENHQCEASKLVLVRELIRLAIEAHTGRKYEVA